MPKARAPARGAAPARPATARLPVPGAGAAALAIASGAMAALTVPPFDQSWLAWGALVPLLVAARREPPAAAFACAILTGLTMFIGLGYGTFAFDPFVGAIVVGGLTAMVGGAVGTALVLERATARVWLRPLLLPSLWVLGERVCIAANAPWSAALSQTSQLPLIQAASVLGGLWISFLIVLVNGALAALVARAVPGAAPDPDARATSRAALALAALACTATLGFGWWALARLAPAERTLHVAAIQPLILTHEYRYEGLVPDYRRRNAAAVDTTTAAATQGRPDLLVWPEGGNGLFNFRVAARREQLSALARTSGAGLVISSYDLDSDGRLFNSAFSIAPSGELLGRYDKVALTPVGERDFTPGAGWSPLPTHVGPVGVLVCFESVFSAPARSMVDQGAVLLLVTTSDASFRNSNLAALHARSAIYRAVENRRDVVQASNTGPSMLVSASGEIRAQTPFFARTVLDGSIGLRRDRSLYARLGDGPLLALCVAVVVLAIADAVGRRGRVRQGRRSAAGAPPVWMLPVFAAAATAVGLALAAASLWLTVREVPAFPSWRAALAHFLVAPVVPLSADTAAAARQKHPNTCGPAALAFLANYLGVATDEDAVARLVRLGPDGTSLADLATAAATLGLSAWGEHQNLAALREIPKPVIAHIRDDHYVVVLAVDAGDQIDLFDPSTGYVRIAAVELERSWDGNLLLVRFPKLKD